MNSTTASEIYVGLMSGTSLDGVDISLVDFADFPPRILHHSTTPYPQNLRQRLHRLCQSADAGLDSLYSIDAELGEVYAETVNQALEFVGLDAREIIAIGCHGQTIRHSPNGQFPYSAQIGDPNRLTTLTGIATVADFRRKDIALGGQAAPLAPAFHHFLFHADDEDRVVINIGGIANITHLPKDLSADIIGFDSGPGNTLLDHWIETQLAQPYDSSGEWARDGQIIDELLRNMLESEPYFTAPAPKSTGTEYFNGLWLEAFLRKSYAPQDVQATLVELTACSVATAIRGLSGQAMNCFVCGGGAHNDFLLERLQQHLDGGRFATTAALGLNPDYVEATAFAWLARERINLRTANIPSVTQATRGAILGAVYQPE